MIMVAPNSTHHSSYDLTNAWDHVDDVVDEISEDYFDSMTAHSPVKKPVIHKQLDVNKIPNFLHNLTTNVAKYTNNLNDKTDMIEDYDSSPVSSLHLNSLAKIGSVINETIAGYANNLEDQDELFDTDNSEPAVVRQIRSLSDHYITHGECRRSNIIGELVTDASQFLFPCTIEYSLICAAILYIMWKNISHMFVRLP